MSRQAVVLGIDGGGTKTRCLVAGREDGTVLGEGLAGPSNMQAVGLQQAAANVREAAEQALAAAGLDLSSVDAVCAGLAGVGRPDDQAAMQAALAFFSPAALLVVPDARIALAGALGGRPGVVVISGTGSIAYGIDAAGQTIRAGGWGWILGDEGSGYQIGRKAVTAALAGHDGTGPVTLLAGRILAEWGLERLEQVVPLVYGDVVAAKGRIAALMPLVVAAADDGDAVAASLLQDAGQSLGILAAAVAQRITLAPPEVPLVAVTGGVLAAVPAVQMRMALALAERVPKARLVPAAGSPAEGALLMAKPLLTAH